MKQVYHSALRDELDVNKELDYFTDGNNIVFRYDICKGFHQYGDSCDLLYSEPSWEAGYKKFLDRAGKEQSVYKDYMNAVSDIVKQTSKPTWIILGKHAQKFFDLDRVESIVLHGYKTNVCGWNDNNDYKFGVSNYEFVQQLSKRYNRMWDFSCGYGTAGMIFMKEGKNFVLSDINGKCVYYIAKQLGYK